jgi:sugar/nucleoside kinase (ribokinase family)
VSPKPIVVVGSMAFDDLEFPRPVPDPGAPGTLRTSFRDVIGGSATYASLSASCFAPVRVVAVVGDDFPASVLDLLRARGIDTSGIERASGKTFHWSGRYHDDLVARTSLDTQLNVFADFRPKLPEPYRGAPLVLLGNIHPALQLEVLEQMNGPAYVMADTMDFWIRGEPALLARVLERVDTLIVNDEEVRQLSGIHNITRAARDVLARGPQRVVIKRGEHGSIYFDAEGVFAAPALPLEDVIDPTGAGDSFAGGLLGYLAACDRVDHAAMRRAMVHGTATASFCVQALGTSGLLGLDATAVEHRVAQIKKLYHLGD